MALILLILALIAGQLVVRTQARTVYVDGAHVYLPRLRRILSFGGVLNNAPQDSIVSLDLSTTWKTSEPAMTVLSPSLTEPAANLIPHVSRSSDGTYTILLYGTTIGKPPSAQNNKVKQWRITTKDAKKLESLAAIEVAASAYAPINPCMSTAATPLGEMFGSEANVQEELALTYVYGGYPRTTTTFDTTTSTSLVLAELGIRASGDAMKPLAAGDRRGPGTASSCALSYISPTRLLVHAALNGDGSGTPNPAVYDLVNMRWDEYKGAYPMASRSKNQFVLYNKSPTSGRSYVFSVGSYWRTDGSNTPFSSIWYSELDGEKAWINATVYGDPGFMFRHGAVVVDNQLLVMGFTDDISAAQAATAVAVFTITEPNPGNLEFRWSERFVPSPVGSGGAAGDAAIKPPSMSTAILAAAVVSGVGLIALVAFFVYRRVRKSARDRFPDPSAHSNTNSTHKPNPTPNTNAQHPNPLPAPSAGVAATDNLLSDEILFGRAVGGNQQPPPVINEVWDNHNYNRAPGAFYNHPAPSFGTLPPAPPQPDAVVDERVQRILNDPRRSFDKESQDEPLILAPGPAALTGRP